MRHSTRILGLIAGLLLLVLVSWLSLSRDARPAVTVPQPSSPMAQTPESAPEVLPESSRPDTLRDRHELSAEPASGGLLTGEMPVEDHQPPDLKKIAAFADWAKRWQAATPAQREAMLKQGETLAAERRPEMKRLIRDNPREALINSVPRVVRQDLPPEILAHLEQPISAHGNYKVYLGKPQPGVVLPQDTDLAVRYFEPADGKSYKARVFGKMQPVMSLKSLPVTGVAIDRELAVAESPVRVLESGERIPAGVPVDQTCPVSGITTPGGATTPVTDAEPAVEVEGRIIRLCNGSHVTVFDESYTRGVMASGAGGAGYFYDNYPGTSSEAIGNFRCLYIRVTYPDQMRAPNSESSAYGDMRNVARFYLESSFGRMTTTAVVTPLIVMPHTKAWYIAKDAEVDGLGLVHSDARAEARKIGYDSGQFNCTIVRVNEGPRLSGISWGGGDSVWVSWDGMDVLDHECGHSLGLNHANFWQTSDGSAMGVGANQEYGNSFDVMGGGSGFGAHYNTISKRLLGWLSDAYVYRPTTSPSWNGVYRLYAYDQPQLEEGKKYSFRVDKDPTRQLYLEYHPAAGGKFTDAVTLLVKGLGSNAGHLIDTTPGSPDGKNDAGIPTGRTFSDFESDIHITTLGKNATTPPSMDIAYMRGPFPGNLPPTVTLNASATSISTGGSITFTANATDPNGDTLAYNWDFADGYVAPNAAVVTRTFSSAVQMTVELTVSDMKGGTARAHVVVTVGSPGRGVISGQITDGTNPIPGVRVTSTTTSKYCYTDSNGNYALSNLTIVSHTLAATLTGYTFTANFTNPETPTANTTIANQNWTAASVPEVTITATDGAEGGANGSFVITRTGDTSAALDVNVAPVGGNATKTTDYTFSPDYVANGTVYKFTIPAGQASLTVVVAAVNDTAAEGPETVQLYLAVGAYQVRKQGVATLTITDNDTTKPLVSIVATDSYASETAGDPGTFLISRTGPTTAALDVAVGYSGTATRGNDYPNLPTTVTIPAGAASTTLSLVPTDDSVIEVPEDATVTISANANYIVNSTASAATVTISDNDMAVVSVTALDATLTEANRKPGIVLISRTGDLTQSLKVYYGLGGSALHGTDYMQLPGEITIPAGQASAPVFITPYDDGFGEPDETITFSLTSFNNAYTLGANYTTTLTIKDNSDGPLITVSANSAAEPSTSGAFTFTARGSVSGTIPIHYTLSGTATPGVDYTAPSGTVNISGNGTNTATVTIPILDDAIAEDTETIILTITPDPAYTVANDGTAVMRLKDNDSDQIAVSTHSATLAEPSSASSFYLSRSGTTGALDVTYTMSGTATNGVDYTQVTGTATIPDGATGVDVAITPINDSLAEGTETVILTVVPGTGYGIEVGSATLYLTDDDTSAMASVGFALTTSTTSEALDPTLGEYRDFQVTLSAAQTNTVTAQYSAGAGGSAFGDDVDWAFVNASAGNAIIPGGVVTFPPGTTTQNIRIRVKNDGVVEGNETAVLELKNVIGAKLNTSKNKLTLTITDANNPTPRVSFLVASSTKSEAAGKEPLLMAVLDRALTTSVSVSYTVGGTATQGSDYTLPPGTLTFAAGETMKPLPLTILPDGQTELSETIIVTLTNPVGAEIGAIPTHTITLTEANVPIVSVDATTPETIEGGTPAAFTITRSTGLGLNLTVNYTLSGSATNTSDYATLSGSVVLPSGQASVVVPVSPVDDSAQEQDETVTLTISTDVNYAIGSPGAATVTIFDNDSPPDLVLLSPAQPDVAIPTGVGLICQAQATTDTPQGPIQQPVSWSFVSGPGTPVIEAPSSASTGITFPANGVYVLRVSSNGGAAVAQKYVSVSVGTAVYPSRDIYNTTPPTAAGSVTVSNDIYSVKGGGSGISSSGTSDGFYFTAAPLTGDFDVQGRLPSFTGTGSSQRMGIMARDILSHNAPYVFSFFKGNSTSHFLQYRTTTGATPTQVTGGAYAAPQWMRLKRVGNVFSAYASTDGTSWTQTGTSQTITLATTCYVGLAVTTASTSTAETAVFDNLNFAPVVNVGPNVNAGPALSGSGPWVVDGTVTDDGRAPGGALSTLWTTYAGTGSATFTNSTAVDGAVTFPASGSFTLRLTATDTHTTTYDDTIATVTALTPMEKWRQDKFGANAGNSTIAGDNADPDGDGMINVLEYGLNLNPMSQDPVALRPTPFLNGDVLSIDYRKNLSATDVVYTVQGTADFSTWTNIAVTESVLNDDGQTRLVRATPTSPITGGRYFLRIQVTVTNQ